MKKYKHTLLTLYPGLLLAALLSCSSLTRAAEPAGGGAAAHTPNPAAANLNEHGEIRKVSE